MFSKVNILATLTLAMGLVSNAQNNAVHVGDATLFHPSGLLACNVTRTDADLVAGVSADLFGTGNPADSPLCGRWIVVNSPDGKSVRAQIENECATCTKDDVILSQAAFSVLADPSVGVIHNAEWFFFVL